MRTPPLVHRGISIIRCGGSKRAKLCAGHAKDKMVDLHSKRYGHEGCTTGPSCGVEGSKIADFGTQHAMEGIARKK